MLLNPSFPWGPTHQLAWHFGQGVNSKISNASLALASRWFTLSGPHGTASEASCSSSCNTWRVLVEGRNVCLWKNRWVFFSKKLKKRQTHLCIYIYIYIYNYIYIYITHIFSYIIHEHIHIQYLTQNSNSKCQPESLKARFGFLQPHPKALRTAFKGQFL